MRKRIGPGPWRTQRTTWMAEHFGIDPNATITNEVVIMASSATGKTDNGLAWPPPRVVDAPRPPHPDGNRAARRRGGPRHRARSYGQALADAWASKGDAWLLAFLRLPEVRVARGVDQLLQWLDAHEPARAAALRALLRSRAR